MYNIQQNGDPDVHFESQLLGSEESHHKDEYR